MEFRNVRSIASSGISIAETIIHSWIYSSCANSIGKHIQKGRTESGYLPQTPCRDPVSYGLPLRSLVEKGNARGELRFGERKELALDEQEFDWRDSRPTGKLDDNALTRNSVSIAASSATATSVCRSISSEAWWGTK
jgi:hypothetical protein